VDLIEARAAYGIKKLAKALKLSAATEAADSLVHG